MPTTHEVEKQVQRPTPLPLSPGAWGKEEALEHLEGWKGPALGSMATSGQGVGPQLWQGG